ERDDLFGLARALGDLGVGISVGDQSEQALLTLGQALEQPVAFRVAQALSSSGRGERCPMPSARGTRPCSRRSGRTGGTGERERKPTASSGILLLEGLL